MNKNLAIYAVLGVLGALLAALNQAIGAGTLPIPASAAWIGPLLAAGLIAACANIDSIKISMMKDLGSTIHTPAQVAPLAPTPDPSPSTPSAPSAPSAVPTVPHTL